MTIERQVDIIFERLSMASFVICFFISYSKPAVLLLSGQAVLCCMLSACVFSLRLHVTDQHPVSLAKPISSAALIALLM